MPKTPTAISFPEERSSGIAEAKDAREVLRQLREHDFDSRDILERRSGLSSSRLSAAVSFLAKKGLIERSSNGKSNAGRRNMRFALMRATGMWLAWILAEAIYELRWLT